MIRSIAGLAEDAPDHDLVDRLERLAEVVADEDALARGQAVGLEHQPERAPEHEVAGLGGRVEDALLAALFDLDLDARAEHLARVHDPVDRLERLGRPSGSGACGGASSGRATGPSAPPRASGHNARRRAPSGTRGNRPSGCPPAASGPWRRPCFPRARPLPSAARRPSAPRAGRCRRSPWPAAPPGRPRSGRSPSFLANWTRPRWSPGSIGDVLHVEGRAGVARCAEDGGDPRRLLELPAQGVFPPSFAHDEDFQGTGPHSGVDPPASAQSPSYSKPGAPRAMGVGAVPTRRHSARGFSEVDGR